VFATKPAVPMLPALLMTLLYNLVMCCSTTPCPCAGFCAQALWLPVQWWVLPTYLDVKVMKAQLLAATFLRSAISPNE
jgi:hypothetical protein